MKLKIKTTNEAHPIIEAIRAEETAQALKAEAEQAQRIKEHNRRNRRNEARKQARQEAEAEAERIGRPREIKAPEPRPIKTAYLIYAGSQTAPTPIITEPEAEAEEAKQAKEIKPLSNISFICLYNSSKVIFNGERLKPTTHEERIIINYLKAKNPLIYLNKATQTRTKNLNQISFNLNEANTPQARKYILSFKGEAEKATNTQQTETGADKPILSYNKIEYEPNEIIIISDERRLKTIIKKFQRKNKTENSYYDFITESPAIRTKKQREQAQKIKKIQEKKEKVVQSMKQYKKAPEAKKAELIGTDTRRRTHETTGTRTTTTTTRGNRPRHHRERMIKNLLNNIDYWNEAEPEEKARLINNCLYYENKQTKTETTLKTKTRGLNNITENEKEAIKKITGNRPEFETKKEARDLIRIATAEDGRFTQANIEHSIRNNPEIKRLKAETSTALYFIIEEVEEATKEAKKDIKKQTALLNVLKSFKQTAELKEELQESITEQIEEAENRQTTFKGNKKGKNRYNTKTGLTTPNRKPTHQENKYRNKNQERRQRTPQELHEERSRTENNKKIKRNVLLSFSLLQEVKQEAEARQEAEQETKKEARTRKEEQAQKIARRNNTRELKRIQAIKAENHESRQEKRRETPTLIYKMLERENEKQKVKYEIAQKIREQAHNRHIRQKHEKEFIKSIIWQPSTTTGEKKAFIHIITQFKTGNEI